MYPLSKQWGYGQFSGNEIVNNLNISFTSNTYTVVATSSEVGKTISVSTYFYTLSSFIAYGNLPNSSTMPMHWLAIGI